MSIRIDFADPRARQTITEPPEPGLTAATGSVPPLGDAGQLPGSPALRCRFEAPLHTLVAHTPAQVKPLLDAVEAHARAGRWCVGYVTYEAASAFDAALQTHPADGPLAWFGVFAQALPWENESSASLNPTPTPSPTHMNESAITPALTPNPATDNRPAADADDNTQPVVATTVQWHSALTRAQFDTNLSAIHEAIAAGEYYQVNYTAPLLGDFTGSPAELFERLQRAQPDGYAALIDTGPEQVLSVSPELFFDWDGNPAGGHILTRPMKGTAPRGNTPGDDAALAQSLTTSPKERAENVMIVDLLRNDLSRIAQPHSVQVPALFAVQSLPTLHQMVSDVTAQTRPGTTLSDVFGALFPCGSITGAPKVRAMQTIMALEPQPRGVYCGTIGVVRPGGHATFNVAIRTVTIHGTQARCGIGSGITFDATPEREWQEWQHKRGFLERASEPFQLLETLRLQCGVFHNSGAHLARLARAAAHFGYVFDEASIRAELNTLLPDTANDPQALWRVRLLLGADGTPHAEKYVQNSTPAPVSIGLAATPFEASNSEFTRFKTTRRAHYEAFAPTNPALFDTLLYNSAGELTECTRGNIAVLLNGQWLTPALHCGLLAGVERAKRLDEGRMKEAVITLDDLPRATGLAFVNSLRGWVPARLIS